MSSSDAWWNATTRNGWASAWWEKSILPAAIAHGVRRVWAGIAPQRSVLGIVNRPGVFAEYVTLPVENLHKVPDEISDPAATFTEPVAAACEILEQMTLAPGTRVAIIGDGRLGLLVAQVLKHAGAQVTLIGRHGWKLDLARAWGVRVLSEGDEELAPSSFPVTVEATGSPRGISEALRLVEPRGTVVMKSTFHGAANFDATKLVVDEVTLLGSRCGVFAPGSRVAPAGARDGSPSDHQNVSVGTGN